MARVDVMIVSPGCQKRANHGRAARKQRSNCGGSVDVTENELNARTRANFSVVETAGSDHAVDNATAIQQSNSESAP